jgi:hypothetical protein
LLYERGVFQQFDDLCPNDLIEQVLPDHWFRQLELAPFDGLIWPHLEGM